VFRGLIVAALVSATAPAVAQEFVVEPTYAIWDVKIGEPLAQIPVQDVNDLACGTMGGPPSVKLASLEAFTSCPPEPSGLREVHFSYDDEMDYVARAMEVEYRAVQGGTSVYAHPVIVSVLVDDEGIVRGIRIVTDDRVSNRDRRSSVTLASNLKARFGGWTPECADIPPKPGQNPVGKEFIHEVCLGENTELGLRFRIEAFLLRKRGQEALNRETQQANEGYFASGTWFEMVEMPYEPAASEEADS
jgi:hypothetical protein